MEGLRQMSIEKSCKTHLITIFEKLEVLCFWDSSETCGEEKIKEQALIPKIGENLVLIVLAFMVLDIAYTALSKVLLKVNG